MFAFALWDRSERTLTLVRDQVGKKPLYFGWSGGVFLFGSELKALCAHPRFDRAVNRNALGEYTRFGWVPEPLAIYADARKLQPGHCLTVRAGTAAWSAEPRPYWDAGALCEQAVRDPFGGSYQEAVDRLDVLLRQSVADRMVADVDLGALLSGGIDSTTVVALMQQLSDRPTRTFSIGFEDPKFNEADHARAIARHLGTEHHEQYVKPQDCLALVDRLPTVYDEPFADVSQVPTLLVAGLARESVTVVLSGDGGDELFGGYTHYFEALAQWRRMRPLPAFVRAGMSDAVTGLSGASWRLLRNSLWRGGKARGWKRGFAKLERRMRGWRATTPQQLLLERFARVRSPGDLVAGYRPDSAAVDDPDYWLDSGDALLKMRHLDFISFLPGDILVKVDRASMAVALEARCPILDTRVAEFAWSLPRDYLIDAKGGKRVLRDLMSRYVPRQLTDRPKRGFGVPVDEWLRTDLREWALDLLNPATLRREGLFDVDAVQTVWKQHTAGWFNHDNLLWALLMFQSWKDRWQDAGTSTGQGIPGSSAG
jgi:asparagine synthase (glutamine-hydrolysing)